MFPQFHWAIDAIGASTYGERQGYKNISLAMKTMLNEIDLEAFDHVFLFSDHGFKFSCELRTNPSYQLLDEDRTNVLFLHKQKGQSKLSSKNVLCSLIDFKKLCKDILNGKRNIEGKYALQERKHIIIEDHGSINVGIYDPIERWALKTKAAYYIRDLEFGFCKNDRERKFNSKICKNFDAILLDNAEFMFVKEVKRLRNFYKKTVKKNYVKEDNIYDHRQIKINSVISNYYKLIDLIKYRVKGL